MLKYNRIRLHKALFARRCLTSAPEEEYTDTPQYPPILDLSVEKKFERKKIAKHDEIKLVKTIEEKQIKLNMPRYYGFKTYMLDENFVPYDNLALTQHITRTHLIETEKLPSYYDSIEVGDIENLKGSIQDAILSEIEGFRKEHDIKGEPLTSNEVENLIGSNISKHFNRIFFNVLSKSNPHLNELHVDLDPRIEACWFCSGMDPPQKIKAIRRSQSWNKHRENEPTDRLFSYPSNPCLTLRSAHPLPIVISESEAENPNLDVPVFKYSPRTVGIHSDYRRIVNVPGYWPGDPYRFGVLSYLKRGHLSDRHYGDAMDDKNAVHRQGILASYSWLNAQANMLGFTTFNDITYPLVTQTVITNGQLVSLYVYQLNTLLLHSKHISENPKRNVCWATPVLKLYEKIEDGKIIGFNDELLANLAKFYLNRPKPRFGVNLTPYLSEKEKVAADYEDPEQREWLEREYKFLTSNRPRYYEMDELYAWEKIYKVDHKMRFMDKRLRFFELRQKPWQRTLDNRRPIYVPRALRPDLPRNKGRYKREFWP